MLSHTLTHVQSNSIGYFAHSLLRPYFGMLCPNAICHFGIHFHFPFLFLSIYSLGFNSKIKKNPFPNSIPPSLTHSDSSTFIHGAKPKALVIANNLCTETTCEWQSDVLEKEEEEEKMNLASIRYADVCFLFVCMHVGEKEATWKV